MSTRAVSPLQEGFVIKGRIYTDPWPGGGFVFLLSGKGMCPLKLVKGLRVTQSTGKTRGQWRGERARQIHGVRVVPHGA